jgi:hypothetical protein
MLIFFSHIFRPNVLKVDEAGDVGSSQNDGRAPQAILVKRV